MPCVNCQGPITIKKNMDGTPRKNQPTYCSRECRAQSERRRYFPDRRGIYLPTATIGTISEMAVAVLLMNKGWSVFKSLSPASAFDIVAFKNGEMRKIEIKTGHMSKTGNLSFPKHKHSAHDQMAVVFDEHQIRFIPDMTL